MSLKFYVLFPLPGKNCLLNCAFIPSPERTERVHSAQRKKPINTFGYSRPIPKAGTTFTCQSTCNFFTPIPPTIQALRTKDLLWPPGLWHPRLLPLLLLAFSPTSARPVLFHENISPINPACLLIGMPICNSLLHRQEEQGFSCSTIRRSGMMTEKFPLGLTVWRSLDFESMAQVHHMLYAHIHIGSLDYVLQVYIQVSWTAWLQKQEGRVAFFSFGGPSSYPPAM